MPLPRRLAVLCLLLRALAGGATDAVAATGASPNRGVNLLRSGFTPLVVTRNLSQPTWTFKEPWQRAFHQTPITDSAGNIYQGSDAGRALSFDRHGALRWEALVGSHSANCPSLLGDAVFFASGDGFVVSLDAATGAEKWRTKLGMSNPPDTYAVTAVGDLLLVPTAMLPPQPFGGQEVVALRISDGKQLWRYHLYRRHRALTINFLPVISNGMAFFSDYTGGIVCLSLADGQEKWYAPGPDPNSYALGGVSMGPNGVLYLGSSLGGQRGLVRAVDPSDGTTLWQRLFLQEIHSAPAIGPLGPSGKLGLVVPIGSPTTEPETFFEELASVWGVHPITVEGSVFALDADDGSSVWQFRPPPWRKRSSAGYDRHTKRGCFPDLWSMPLIAGDGTVYINWSAGGVTYSLRDADGDGIVSADDPEEVTSFNASSGSTGPPVVGPGMLTVASCQFVYTFLF